MDQAPSTPTGSERPPLVTQVWNGVSAWPRALLVEIGTVATLLGQTIFWAVRPPYRFRLLVASMEFVGVQSIFIVGLTGLFVGMVFGIQLVDGFRQFNAENLASAVVGVALTRELAPVFASLMVSARAGSAMCTELGSMRVTDQVDALTTMAVSPVQYLVVPRVIAAALMLPVLTMLFNLVGIYGAYLVAVKLLGLDPGIFVEQVRYVVDAKDVTQGLVKSIFFGFTIALIACRQGFFAQGGAAGVGQATTRAVVQSAVAILVLDYVITAIITGQGGL